MEQAAYFDQGEFAVRWEWGAEGVARLAPHCDAVIIVDVLSFSTCVDIATAIGAVIYPYLSGDESARAYAQSLGARLAGPRFGVGDYSLSPASLINIPTATRLVLPSPNGSTLSLATGSVATLAGCLRNARAVGEAAQKFGEKVAVIPAGERWSDGILRFALEDWIGAGAIIHNLPGSRSPEAEAAVAAFNHSRQSLPDSLARCASGKELIGRGFGSDVDLAAALNRSDCAPILKVRAYVRST